MKRLVAWGTALLWSLLLLLPAAAAGYQDPVAGVNVRFPEEYTLIENNADSIAAHAGFLEVLGYTPEEFTQDLAAGGVLCFAANAENTVQIQLRVTATPFTQKIQNLAGLTDEETFATVAGELVSATEQETLDAMRRVIREDGTVFLQVQKTIQTGSHAYGCVQYITVFDGSLYLLSYQNFGGGLSQEQLEEASGIFRTLTLSHAGPEARGSLLFSILYGTLIAAAAVLAIGMLVSLIRELYRRRQDSADRISRRKW